MNLFCRDCHKMFEYSEEDRMRHSEKGWSDPDRCPSCKKLYKERKEDLYFGWEGTMRSGGRKQRHTRVPYAPHVVGGFR